MTGGTRRTFAADLPAAPAESPLRLCGWVVARHGGRVTVRDSTGETDVEIGDRARSEDMRHAPTIKVGDAVEIVGWRTEDKQVRATAWTVMARGGPLPARIGAHAPDSYLRFRSQEAVELFRGAERAAQIARDYLRQHHFVEVATPMIWRASREYGDAELTVEDPLHRGQGGYLLQSPTVPQMLCAIGGLDRSYQFARCFRSEPSLSPQKAYEFTQLNLTASFTSTAEHQELLEGLFEALSRGLTGKPWPRPFHSLTYEQAIDRYGCDYPDARFPEIATPYVDGAAVHRDGGRTRLIVVPGGLGGWVDAVRAVLRKRLGDRFGLWSAPAAPPEAPAQWPAPPELAALTSRWEISPPFVVIALPPDTGEALVQNLVATVHRAVTGRRPPEFAAAWISQPPFLNDDPPTAGGHRGRSLYGVRLPAGNSAPDGLTADAYDLVVNGVELVSGSQMESDPRQLVANLRLAGVGEPEADYDYFLRALERGAPPLHNCSVGWERAVALLLGVTMNDAIVMPKTGDGRCQVTGLPVLVG
jgi:aspartyl-tRNA synthetase